MLQKGNGHCRVLISRDKRARTEEKRGSKIALGKGEVAGAD